MIRQSGDKSSFRKRFASRVGFCVIKSYQLTLGIQKMTKTYLNPQLFLAMTFVILFLAGCASEPVPVTKPEPIISGDTMLRESEGMAKLSNRWQSGKDMVDKGNALVEESEAKISEGHRLTDERNKIIRESEQQYKGLKNNTLHTGYDVEKIQYPFNIGISSGICSLLSHSLLRKRA